MDDRMQDFIDTDRRALIGALTIAGLAGAALAVPAAAAGDPAAGELEAAFRTAFVTKVAGPFDPKPRLAFLAPDAIIVDHDVPFPLTAAAWADHLAFHAANWERHEWLPYDLTTRLHGDTGIVSCSYIERGKPKDAGFRLRAGTCAAVCGRDGGHWQAVGIALSPLASQITDASPG